VNDKIKGLVLNIGDYKENDLILQVISEDKGFLSLSGKSAKKISGKQHFVNLCVYEFIVDYKENKTMFSIHGSKLLDNYYEDSNLKLLSFKNILIELTNKSKELYTEDLYKNITFVLSKMNEKNMYLLGSMYISYLLKLHGINPVVDGCVVCSNQNVVGVSKRLGGFVCLNHLGQEETMDVSRLRKFRLINKATISNYDSICDIEFDLIDFRLMMNFFMDNSDMNIKSYKMFKELFD